MGYDVFVSHSAKNKPSADAVVAALERAGVRCWVAPRDILAGEKWASAILRGIGSCRLMLLVFSSHANSSEQIQREIERAVHRGLPILPVRIEDTLPTGDLEYFLSSCHWLDAMTPPFERHLDQLVRQVKTLLELEKPGDVTPPKVQPPATPKRSPVKWIALAAVLLLAAGLGSWLASGGWKYFRPAPQAIAPIQAPLTPPIPQTQPVVNDAQPPAATEPAIVPPVVSHVEPPAATHVEPPPPPPPPAKSYPVAATATRAQRLIALRDEYLDGNLTLDQYQLSQALFDADPPSDYDHDRLAEFNNLLEGRLAPEHLQRALDAVPTPQQRAEAAKEAKIAQLLADAHANEAKIAQLLADAHANNDDAHSQVALSALESVLQLDPGNSDATSLKQEITARLQREAAAAAEAARQAKIAGLLATAHADDSPEKGHDALAALDQLLALDSGNQEALDLKKKISAYYVPSKIGDTWTNTVGLTFAYIPAGEFDMGSPQTETGRFDNEVLHHVKLTKPFLMATTHVTVAQFTAFVKDSGYQTDAEKEGFAYAWTGTAFDKVNGASWRNPGFPQGDDHPVVCVSWNDATAYCDWLSKKEGKHYRLPTEAEWEYACRAGKQTAYWWGDNPDDGNGCANCADQTAKAVPQWDCFSWTDGYVYTSPVGKFKPNAWGLYDMIGNALEWCNDWYGDYNGNSVDPQGPANGQARVLRGGSWLYFPRFCRCAYRFFVAPDARDDDVGFRLSLDFD